MRRDETRFNFVRNRNCNEESKFVAGSATVLALRLGFHRKCTKPNYCTLSTFAHLILIDNYFILSLFGVSYLYFHS